MEQEIMEKEREIKMMVMEMEKLQLEQQQREREREREREKPVIPSNEEELKRIRELEETNENLTILLNNAEKKYSQLSSINVDLQKKINSLEQFQAQQAQLAQQDQM